MNPERWGQIEGLYHAALERAPEERQSFLDKACGEDLDLRREVESLLGQEGAGLLSQPLDELADGLLDGHFRSGAMVGPYRIAGRLGAGGMGDVYRATDTRLHRTVAIKTLKAGFSDRFEREARAISALNHPHICTLYDIGSQDSAGYLVMEYVEGEPLKGPLPVAEALRFAIQIASALEAAHEKGILHRDLKPGNILVSKSGVKLLDFGLAKIAPSEPRPSEVTITASLTDTGQVLGTPAYMSPEQIEGKAADARSDIFSLGLVIYEMVARRRAFESDSRNGLMAAILKEEAASLTALQPAIPVALDRAVRKCLAKDPARRWQTALELRQELEAIAAGDSAGSRNYLRWIAGAAVLLAVIGAGYFYLHRAPKLTDRDTIVLADFTNTTGDAVFDGTLRQGLAVQLEQSPFLSLVSEQRIRKTLSLTGRQADAPLTAQVALEVCERIGSAAVLDGSIAPIGSQYVLGLRAKNCRTGDVLDEEQAQAARKEDVLSALSQIASKFRMRVGESLATVEKHSTPLAEATTQSLEALKTFSAGMKVLFTTGAATAVPFFKRATEIDPKFAMAHAFLGRVYGDIGETALSAESTTKAYELQDRASDAEKFFITTSYNVQVTGNLEKARQVCEEWGQAYPRDEHPLGFLSGMIYPVFGELDKGLEDAKKLVEIAPDFPIAYNLLALSYQALDRLEESENVLRSASARKIEIPDLIVDQYDIAFLKGDKAGMEREVALSRGKSGAEDWLADQEALVLAYSGILQNARKRSQRAADVSAQSAERERMAMWRTGPAVWEALFGDAPAARKSAATALELSKARDVEYGAAFALAHSGDSSRAQALADDLERRFPEDTAVKINYLPVLRAVLALNRGESASAIELLQINAPYELGAPPSAFFGFFGAFYPIYVRGEAYLAAGRGTEAAAEFQKILSHRGIVISDPIGALARLQLGRALALSGDRIKAKTAYEDFLTLWKDADSDIPIFQQAKTEYAKLL